MFEFLLSRKKNPSKQKEAQRKRCEICLKLTIKGTE